MALPEANSNPSVNRKVIEIALQLGVLFALIAWSFTIIKPFVNIIVWAAIVAIALYPVFVRLSTVLGGRRKLVATGLALALVAIVVLPTAALTESLVIASQSLQDGREMTLPAPPPGVADWPLVGEQIHATWQRAAEDPPGLLREFAPQIKAVGTWLLETVAGTGLGILQFVVSFAIAGVLLIAADKGARTAATIATRLAGARGPGFAALATITIRNVALGIVGVSIVQTALLGLGFLAIGLPGAGLAAVAVLVLCIVQVGPTLVSLPAIIYVFTTADTLPAVIFTVWTVAMSLIDSVLKPLVFGRGASVPTLVIFLGAIGGMMAYGILGLFIGAVVLSVAYTLYEAWLDEAPLPDQTARESEAP